MASWLTFEIEGDKNRLFRVKPRSKIPVRKANPLSSDNGKSSSSKEEADKKERIQRDFVEKLQNKRPSRIPIALGRTNNKTDKDKFPKNGISATRKRPLGKDSGINLQEMQGKQTARIKTTANPPNSAKHSNPEHVTESTPPLRRTTLMRQVTPLNTKRVSKDEKEPQDEKSKEQSESVQSVDLSSMCEINRAAVEEIDQSGQNSCGVTVAKIVTVSGRVLQNAKTDYAHLREEVELLKGSLDLCNHREDLLRRQVDALEKQVSDFNNSEQASKSNVKTELQSNNGVSISCEEGHKKELEHLEKEHSEIVEELQQWVEDGDNENKTLKEIIEKTNEENVKLLVQISAMKKEMKALENKNEALQTDLEIKRVDLKRLRVNAYFNERELRNLKRDLKKKEQKMEELEQRLDNALMEKEKLLYSVEYLEESLKESQRSNERLNAYVDELKKMVQRADQGHLREEIEHLKGSLDLCNHREKLLRFQVNALEAEASHFKTCELDYKRLQNETSSLIDQLEVQLDTFLNENARIISEKDREFSELNDENSKVVGHLEDQLATLMDENARILSEKNKQINEIEQDELRAIDRLENQLASLMNENVRILSEKNKQINELEQEKSTAVDQLENQLASLMKENTRIISEKDKLSEMNELKDDKSKVVEDLEYQLSTLMNENARIISEKDKELHERQEEKSRLVARLEFQLTTFMNENARITSEKDKEMKELNDDNARVISQLENQLAELKNQNSVITTELSKVSDKDKRLTELQEKFEILKKQNNLTRSELDIAHRSLKYTDEKTVQLMKELERERFDKDVLAMALEFSLDNCAIKERVHVRETTKRENELAEMKRSIMREKASTADAKKGDETLIFLSDENRFCMQLCEEKFFAM